MDSMARLNITYQGHNGDLPNLVDFDLDDRAIRTFATEAVRGGGVPGIPVFADASFEDFRVDRFPAVGNLPNRISLRPKVPFG